MVTVQSIELPAVRGLVSAMTFVAVASPWYARTSMIYAGVTKSPIPCILGVPVFITVTRHELAYAVLIV